MTPPPITPAIELPSMPTPQSLSAAPAVLPPIAPAKSCTVRLIHASATTPPVSCRFQPSHDVAKAQTGDYGDDALKIDWTEVQCQPVLEQMSCQQEPKRE